MKVAPVAFLTHVNAQSLVNLPLLACPLPCGFPSPASDYLETMPSLDELLIKHPSATILGRASGDSMIERGILDGALLIIDRAIQPWHGATIVAAIDGELTIKILDLQHQRLLPANPHYSAIPLPDELNVCCEGVVTYSINPQQRS